MADVRLAHTADLPAATLRAVRELLDGVFDGDFSDDDWEHALGGIHALVWDGAELIAHGAVVQRRLLHGGRAWRTGYVEGVGVRADRRRGGHGRAVMAELERVVRGGYALGALSATDAGAGLYTALGWQRWRGTTAVLAPDGRRRTPDDDDSVFVLPVASELDLTGDLACDWRDGAVW